MLKLIILGLTLVSSVRAYIPPLCNFDYVGRYVCYPIFPPPIYFDQLKLHHLDFQKYVTNDINNYYDWEQESLKKHFDFENQFPWLYHDPYIQYNQLQRKYMLDYNQAFFKGYVEHDFKTQDNIVHNDAIISKNQHDVISG